MRSRWRCGRACSPVGSPRRCTPTRPGRWRIQEAAAQFFVDHRGRAAPPGATRITTDPLLPSRTRASGERRRRATGDPMEAPSGQRPGDALDDRGAVRPGADDRDGDRVGRPGARSGAPAASAPVRRGAAVLVQRLGRDRARTGALGRRRIRHSDRLPGLAATPRSAAAVVDRRARAPCRAAARAPG